MDGNWRIGADAIQIRQPEISVGIRIPDRAWTCATVCFVSYYISVLALSESSRLAFGILLNWVRESFQLVAGEIASWGAHSFQDITRLLPL